MEESVNKYPSFMGQNIDEIRKEMKRENKKFEDHVFPPKMKSIIPKEKMGQTDLEKGLIDYLGMKDEKDPCLEKAIVWQRIDDIVRHYNASTGKKYEAQFVMNEKREPPREGDEASYLGCFESNDTYQGCVGNCYHVAALMGVTESKDSRLIRKLFPIDNSYRENMNLGVYHFRFWYYGEWIDVVVDDYLPMSLAGHVLFCHNDEFRNEFWGSLSEKAFVKICGSYAITTGGKSEESLLFLTGGMGNTFTRLPCNQNERDKNKFVECLLFYLQDRDTNLLYLDSRDQRTVIDMIRIGLKRKFVVGVGFLNDFDTKRNKEKVEGLHAYNIVEINDNDGYITLDNPYNKPVGNNTESKGAQVKIDFTNFIDNLAQIFVFNLDLEDYNQTLSSIKPQNFASYKEIKEKTNLLSKWRIDARFDIIDRKFPKASYFMIKRSNSNRNAKCQRIIVQLVLKLLRIESKENVIRQNVKKIIYAQMYTQESIKGANGFQTSKLNVAELLEQHGFFTLTEEYCLLEFVYYDCSNLEKMHMRILSECETSSSNEKLISFEELTSDQFNCHKKSLGSGIKKAYQK